jgi:quercetin dioxygenase-like cupin family protein
MSETATLKPTITFAKDAKFEPGLRDYNRYRDLGIAEATGGKFQAHVIRAHGLMPEPSGRHEHILDFQLVYVLRGSMTVEFPGDGVYTLHAGDSMLQPSGIAHNVLSASEDMEVLEIVSPAEFETNAV